MKHMIKVLIVHKDKKIRQLVGKALNQEGFETVTVSDSLQGIRALYRTSPHLVIAGQELSLLNSEDFCIRLRRVSSVPLIVLGSRNGEATLVRILEMGADAYIPPPLDVQELIARVQSFVRRLKPGPEHVYMQSCAIEDNPGMRDVTIQLKIG